MRCRDVARAIAAGELEQVPLGRRVAVRLHLLMCRHCRRYAAQIRAIGQAARELFREAPAEQAVVERLREAVLAGREGSGRSAP